jgi:hypothetical protein
VILAADFLQRGETRGRRLRAPISGVAFLLAHFGFGNDFTYCPHNYRYYFITLTFFTSGCRQIKIGTIISTIHPR